MNHLRLLSLTVLSLFFSLAARAQDDLLNMISDDSTAIDYTYATFKTNRIVNSHSVEITAPGELQFVIGHRFGRLNSGAYNLWGLDESRIRLGFEYGINKVWAIGIGRSSEGKTYDAYNKIKLLRQSKGARNMPVTVALLNTVALSTDPRKFAEGQNLEFKHRFTYTHQLLIARKFSDKFSLQIMPTYIHKNLVKNAKLENDILLVGVGARQKLNNRVSINAEYNYIISEQTAAEYTNSLSLGFDIETGGHVFQLFLSNSRGMIEKYFLAENTGEWGKGDIHYGFNITRVFNLRKEK